MSDPHAAPRFSARTLALGTAGLFLISALLQLAASASRWLLHPAGRGGNAPNADDHVYDYFLASEPFTMLPGTSLPFGIGMLLQAGGILALAACLLARAQSAGPPWRVATLLSSFVAAAGPALIGVHAVLTGLRGTLSTNFPPAEPGGVLVLTICAAALILLGIVAAAAHLWLGLGLLCLFGSSVPGYLLASFIIAPLITGDESVDTTRGTETIEALTTLAASLIVLWAGRKLKRTDPAGYLSTTGA